MAVDDMPEPSAESAPSLDELDSAFQQGIDAGQDGFRWIKSALSVLAADIDEGPEGSLECREIRSMRTEAARCISRLMRGVLPDDATEK